MDNSDLNGTPPDAGEMLLRQYSLFESREEAAGEGVASPSGPLLEEQAGLSAGKPAIDPEDEKSCVPNQGNPSQAAAGGGTLDEFPHDDQALEAAKGKQTRERARIEEQRRQVERQERESSRARQRLAAQKHYFFPTESLTPSSRHGASYRNVTRTAMRVAPQLSEDGVLFVIGAHAKLVEAAALEIVFDERFRQQRKLKLYLDKDPECFLRDVLIEGRTEYLGESGPGLRDGGKNIVFVAEVETPAALDQLRDVHSRLKNANRRDHGVYFVFSIFGEAYELWCDRPLHSSLPEWRLDSLSELLMHFNSSGADLTSIIAALRKGQGEDRWPSKEFELLTSVERILQHGGVASLDEAIRSQQSKDRSQLAPKVAEATWNGATQLEKALLFVGVFFPRVTMHQFDSLTNVLLANEFVELDEEGSASTPPGPATGSTRAKVPAYAYWEQKGEQLFHRLGLECVPAGEDDETIIVQFTDGALREAYGKVYFPQDSNRFFNRIYAAGTLFNPKTSREIVNALVQVTARMASRHRDVYNHEWLLEKLAEIELRLEAYAAEAGKVLQKLPDSLVGDVRLRAMVSTIERQWSSYFRQLHHRLVAVCRGFLSHRKTAPIINTFVNQLIALMQPDGTLALKLIRALRSSPDFETTKHIKQIFERADHASRLDAVLFLIEEMRESAEAEQQILFSLSTWHPPREEQSAPASGARLWSLVFIFAVFEEYRSSADGKVGSEPNRRDLHPFSDEPESPRMQARIELLANWLSHPAFLPSLEQVLRQSKPDSVHQKESRTEDHFRVGESCLAEMMESWHAAPGSKGKAVRLLAKRLSTLLDRPMLERLRKLLRRIAKAQDWRVHLIFGPERRSLSNRKSLAIQLAGLFDPSRKTPLPNGSLSQSEQI